MATDVDYSCPSVADTAVYFSKGGCMACCKTHLVPTVNVSVLRAIHEGLNPSGGITDSYEPQPPADLGRVLHCKTD